MVISLAQTRRTLRGVRRRKRLLRGKTYPLFGPRMRTRMVLKYDHRYTARDGRRFVTFELVERRPQR